MKTIRLFQLPSEIPFDLLSNKIAVAIDVLRASTTMITALDAGAECILPCKSIEQARREAAPLPNALLGGERHGQMIEGFDLANSPSDYRPETVAGRPIVFTTTNGTIAIEACLTAHRVLIGAFVNLSAVCRSLMDADRCVVLTCAGTDGVPTDEDVLLGGAICHRLVTMHEAKKGPAPELNQAAQLAMRMWSAVQHSISAGLSLANVLANALGGRNLMKLGLLADIEFASQIDLFHLVPTLDPHSRRILSDVDHIERHG